MKLKLSGFGLRFFRPFRADLSIKKLSSFFPSFDRSEQASLLRMRTDLADEFTRKHGKTPAEFFGTFEYTHKKSGRKV